MFELKTTVLFMARSIAEILGCYLPYLWLRNGTSAWLLVPAAIRLAVFAYLLTLHPTAAGRVYAAYGGVYVSVAMVWLWMIDAVRPTPGRFSPHVPSPSNRKILTFLVHCSKIPRSSYGALVSISVFFRTTKQGGRRFVEQKRIHMLMEAIRVRAGEGGRLIVQLPSSP